MASVSNGGGDGEGLVGGNAVATGAEGEMMQILTATKGAKSRVSIQDACDICLAKGMTKDRLVRALFPYCNQIHWTDEKCTRLSIHLLERYIRDGGDVNEPLDDGSFLLFHARTAATIRHLVQAGAKPDANWNGDTVLVYHLKACIMTNARRGEDCVYALMCTGAKIDGTYNPDKRADVLVQSVNLLGDHNNKLPGFPSVFHRIKAITKLRQIYVAHIKTPGRHVLTSCIRHALERLEQVKMDRQMNRLVEQMTGVHVSVGETTNVGQKRPRIDGNVDRARIVPVNGGSEAPMDVDVEVEVEVDIQMGTVSPSGEPRIHVPVEVEPPPSVENINSANAPPPPNQASTAECIVCKEQCSVQELYKCPCECAAWYCAECIGKISTEHPDWGRKCGMCRMGNPSNGAKKSARFRSRAPNDADLVQSFTSGSGRRRRRSRSPAPPAVQAAAAPPPAASAPTETAEEEEDETVDVSAAAAPVQAAAAPVQAAAAPASQPEPDSIPRCVAFTKARDLGSPNRCVPMRYDMTIYSYNILLYGSRTI